MQKKTRNAPDWADTATAGKGLEVGSDPVAFQEIPAEFGDSFIVDTDRGIVAKPTTPPKKGRDASVVPSTLAYSQDDVVNLYGQNNEASSDVDSESDIDDDQSFGEDARAAHTHAKHSILESIARADGRCTGR